ncbi:type II toxin-antitoxin system RelE family toxin [Arthrobacter sp. KNU-44]|uniref:type II toxin-antitoxin system RelE family toxin n=1 Tax=Arthrobacter sp. KNU-44 TaxID=3450744 RepID=UPI003F4231B7
MTDAESTGSAPWNVEVTGPALKGFRRLPEKAATAIVGFVTGALADNPHRLSKPVTNGLLGLRTARRGDYRVLFTLDIEAHILYVHRIQHRSDVYKSDVYKPR